MLELRISESEQGGALGIQDGWMAMAPDRQRPVFLANKLCNRVWKRSRCPSSYAERCSSIGRGARSTIPLCRNRPVFATPYVCRSGLRRRKETVFPGPDRMMVTSILPDYRISKDVNKPRTGASWIRSRKARWLAQVFCKELGKVRNIIILSVHAVRTLLAAVVVFVIAPDQRLQACRGCAQYMSASCVVPK